ncbi:hypothetical protein CsSME_00019178 [Camellia sinensis var. sinensis]
MARELFEPLSVFGFGIRVDVRVARREVTYPWQTVPLGQTTDVTAWVYNSGHYVEERTEAEIGAAANIEPWLT